MAKKTSKLHDKKFEEGKEIEDVELEYEIRKVYLEVKIETKVIEILIPSNIFDEKALSLKLSAKFIGKL